MSRLLKSELRLFLRERFSTASLILLLFLSAASVWAGLAEIERQRNTIKRVQSLQLADVTAVAERISRTRDAGSAAYYTYHATWDEPSTLAFAAIGQRDIAPFVLRVRTLGLEAQLYENESFNAELALPGRYDWAFVLTYLLPLFVIYLLHDIKSGEREAGRNQVLVAIAIREKSLWQRRAIVKLVALWLALTLPFAVGALVSASNPLLAVAYLVIAAAYVGFWGVLCLKICREQWSSLTNAATLAVVWLTATLILPALAHQVITLTIPVKQGVELTLSQREEIHAGWDRPKQDTMQRFFKAHPEWSNTSPVGLGFHWKWYYAFQHLGDVEVSSQSIAYREALMARDKWAVRAGYVLPPVAVQTLLHSIAKTDLKANLDYQDRIRRFHGDLRQFYYPYVFNETLFTEEDFGKTPRWR
jgi:ABC-2 type transport system permease protein